MSLFYASKGRHLANNGKFGRRRPLGTSKTAGGRHRGWSIEFYEHQTGASVKRTLCSASIRDPLGNRVEYLQGYQSPEAAGEAARQWIDALLAKIRPAGPIEQSIPAPPR